MVLQPSSILLGALGLDPGGDNVSGLVTLRTTMAGLISQIKEVGKRPASPWRRLPSCLIPNYPIPKLAVLSKP